MCFHLSPSRGSPPGAALSWAPPSTFQSYLPCPAYHTLGLYSRAKNFSLSPGWDWWSRFWFLLQPPASAPSRPLLPSRGQLSPPTPGQSCPSPSLRVLVPPRSSSFHSGNLGACERGRGASRNLPAAGVPIPPRIEGEKAVGRGTRGDVYSALPVARVPARSDSQAKARPGRRGSPGGAQRPRGPFPSRPALTAAAQPAGGRDPGCWRPAAEGARPEPGLSTPRGGRGGLTPGAVRRREGRGRSRPAAVTVPATAFAGARRSSEPGFFTCETGASVAMGRAVAKAPMR